MVYSGGKLRGLTLWGYLVLMLPQATSENVLNIDSEEVDRRKNSMSERFSPESNIRANLTLLVDGFGTIRLCHSIHL